ncbi:hypothetical protein C8F04DRAFT_369419 [Mycena alexandri]|uniref:Uncharacterized protein n=1 Tax=Mycena alexandri TaxID=1745969 RepID=A0AAD6T2J4_9AGAR|nr:hypothetical protein C8F04DRAFT_369419 [Mycena alexandri]
MSREDRRPLSQVPEDSVNTYMHPFASYPPPQEPSTLHPPYNPNPIDTFPYYLSDPAAAYLSDPLPPDWAYYQRTNGQDFTVADAEHPCMYHSDHAPYPLSEPFVPIFPDPVPPMHYQETFPQFNPTQPLPYDAAQFVPDRNQLLSHNLDQLAAAYDLNDAMLNLPNHFPEFFAQPGYSAEFHVPTAIEAFEMVQSSSFEGSAPSPAQPPSRRSKTARTIPRVTPSGFIPSDPEDLSPHDKKRLYVACLENYVQYLHQLFDSINVLPVPLERVSSYRGLTTRSLRTILLSLRKSADLIHTLTLKEERRYQELTMRDALFGVGSPDYAESSATAAASPTSDSAGSSNTCVVSDHGDAELLDEIAKIFADCADHSQTC